MKPYWIAKLGGSEFKVSRLQDAPVTSPVTDTPERALAYIRPLLANSETYRPDTENFIVICLNVRMRPIGFTVLCTGTLDSVVVHPRDVFKAAIVSNAHAFIVLHNHPSGE